MKLEDYKRKKGLLPKEDLGTIFTFVSKRDSVKEIKEHLIWEKYISGKRMSPKPEVPIYTYELKESPYSVQIAEDKTYEADPGYASGWGDLWCGTTFCSLDRNVIEELREKELKRVQEKYPEYWKDIVRNQKLEDLGI
jgi:hypothetical protein